MGTLKSTRMRTRFPRTSTSATVLLGIVAMLEAISCVSSNAIAHARRQSSSHGSSRWRCRRADDRRDAGERAEDHRRRRDRMQAGLGVEAALVDARRISAALAQIVARLVQRIAPVARAIRILLCLEEGSLHVQIGH